MTSLQQVGYVLCCLLGAAAAVSSTNVSFTAFNATSTTPSNTSYTSPMTMATTALTDTFLISHNNTTTAATISNTTNYSNTNAITIPTLAHAPTIATSNCSRRVTSCEPLTSRQCLGATLPYTHTTMALADDSASQDEARDRLRLWAGLRNVPRCWDVVQHLLCAVYLPRCNGTEVELPPRELCLATRGPCRVVAMTSEWPLFLQCDHENFRDGCPSKLTSVKFNVTSGCERPLVPTDNEKSWYEGVDGCGIQCDNPLFTAEDHHRIHVFIAVMGCICLLTTLVTIVTFIIDWSNANRYPALILFYINACFFIGSIGWMAQFFPGARDDIVCRSDGTMRRMEPQIGSGETASCAVVFVLVYYFNMAGVTWFAILSYAWHLAFGALGSPKDLIDGKKGHFHLIAWTFPLVLTIVCLALTQIDGDSLSGICFVGYLNHVYRGLFLLLPIALVLVIGLFFLGRGLITLLRLQCDSPGVISIKASAKIRETIIRIGLFAGLAFVFVIITFVVHVYVFTNEVHWEQSFRDFVICEANVTVATSLANQTNTCSLASRPSLVVMQIQIFVYFAAGIIMSSWVWNATSLKAWKRFIRRVLRLPVNEPVKLKKHRVIAQAFHRRHELNNGRLSLSFVSTHDDPLGMKFDLHSVSSREISSAWAAAIPRMVLRRGGMARLHRRYSDSDVHSIQSSCYHLSIESQNFTDTEEVRSTKRPKPSAASSQEASPRTGRPVAPPTVDSGHLSGGGGGGGHSRAAECKTSRRAADRASRAERRANRIASRASRASDRSSRASDPDHKTSQRAIEKVQDWRSRTGEASEANRAIGQRAAELALDRVSDWSSRASSRVGSRGSAADVRQRRDSLASGVISLPPSCGDSGVDTARANLRTPRCANTPLSLMSANTSFERMYDASASSSDASLDEIDLGTAPQQTYPADLDDKFRIPAYFLRSSTESTDTGHGVNANRPMSWRQRWLQRLWQRRNKVVAIDLCDVNGRPGAVRQS